MVHKTCQNIRSCQRQRLESSDVYHRLGWVLPVTGLWHLRLNYLKMIMRTFFDGRKYSDQFSTLYPQINHLDRRNIPKESAPFQHMEELILHSFEARILGILYIHIRESCNIKSSESVSDYLLSLKVEEFDRLITCIHDAFFSATTRRKFSRICQETPKDGVPQAGGYGVCQQRALHAGGRGICCPETWH